HQSSAAIPRPIPMAHQIQLAPNAISRRAGGAASNRARVASETPVAPETPVASEVPVAPEILVGPDALGVTWDAPGAASGTSTVASGIPGAAPGTPGAASITAGLSSRPFSAATNSSPILSAIFCIMPPPNLPSRPVMLMSDVYVTSVLLTDRGFSARVLTELMRLARLPSSPLPR